MKPEELAKRLNPAQLIEAERQFLGRVTKNVERNAKKFAPVRRGTLRRNINSRVEVQGTQVRGLIGTTLDYAPSVHDGSKPHVIRAKNGGVLRFVVGGVVIFRQQVKHPGQKAQPFMTDGLAATREALDLSGEFKNYLAKVAQE